MVIEGQPLIPPVPTEPVPASPRPPTPKQDRGRSREPPRLHLCLLPPPPAHEVFQPPAKAATATGKESSNTLRFIRLEQNLRPEAVCSMMRVHHREVRQSSSGEKVCLCPCSMSARHAEIKWNQPFRSPEFKIFSRHVPVFHERREEENQVIHVQSPRDTALSEK